MRLMRWFGVSELIVGILLLVSFFSKQINPNISLANLGLLSLLFGSLIVGVDGLSRRVKLSETSGGLRILITYGQVLLSFGLLMGLLGLLLENQIMCSCPARESCYCAGLLYNIVFYGGLLIALAGAGLTCGGSILAMKRTNVTYPPLWRYYLGMCLRCHRGNDDA